MITPANISLQLIHTGRSLSSPGWRWRGANNLTWQRLCRSIVGDVAGFMEEITLLKELLEGGWLQTYYVRHDP